MKTKNIITVLSISLFLILLLSGCATCVATEYTYVEGVEIIDKYYLSAASGNGKANIRNYMSKVKTRKRKQTKIILDEAIYE